jgi:hypothetical protein
VSATVPTASHGGDALADLCVAAGVCLPAALPPVAQRALLVATLMPQTPTCVWTALSIIHVSKKQHGGWLLLPPHSTRREQGIYSSCRQ